MICSLGEGLLHDVLFFEGGTLIMMLCFLGEGLLHDVMFFGGGTLT